MRRTIGHLPAELLCEAFCTSVDLCWAEIPPDAFEGGHFPTRAILYPLRAQPFSIAAVCRLWRQVARTYPRLWRRIVVDLRVTMPENRRHLRNDNDPDIRQGIKCWRDYVELLGNLTKSVAVDLVVHLSRVEAVTALGPALLEVASRCRSMLLVGTMSWTPDCVHTLVRTGGEQLESFRLISDRAMHNGAIRLNFFSDTTLNNLKILDLGGFDIDWERFNLRSVREAYISMLSWKSKVTPRRWTQIFTALPNAETLSLGIELAKVDYSDATAYQVTCSHDARHVELAMENAADARYFRFPQARSASIQYVGWIALKAIFIDCLGNGRSPYLTYLKVVNSYFDAEVTSALATIPMLEELHIVHSGIGDSFFPSMSEPTAGGGFICPRLRRFSWKPFTHRQSPVQGSTLTTALVDFVRVRTSPGEDGCRLEEVVIEGWLEEGAAISEEELLAAIAAHLPATTSTLVI